jgi:hypothetical protein
MSDENELKKELEKELLNPTSPISMNMLRKPQIGDIVLFQISLGVFRPFLITNIPSETPIDTINGRLFLESFDDEKIILKSLACPAIWLGLGAQQFLIRFVPKGETVGSWKFKGE